MKIIDRKDAMNRRLYNNQSFVETAIYRVCVCLRSIYRVSVYDTEQEGIVQWIS